MPIAILRRVRRPGISPRRLRAIVSHALRREGRAGRTEVSVVLVDDKTIRRLNRQYRKADRVTDVLAFPAQGPSGQGSDLGDVIVSVDRARIQARSIGHSLRTEIALLAVHGVLHLLNYSDENSAAAKEMARRQRKLVAECGEEVRG